MDEFTEQSVKERLARKEIGHTVLFLRDVDSTNTAAFNLGIRGAAEGTVVVAECQTRGKGRLTRTWQSPPGVNIYASVILRPSIPPSIAPPLTLVAGVAVAELINRYCPGLVTLKWPNDVQIRRKKVCGILAEMKTAAANVDFVILGIGINVNIRAEDFDVSFREFSTSLRDETGGDLSRLDVLAGLFDTLYRSYRQFLQEGFSPIREQWLKYSNILGRQIQVVFRDEVQEGKVIDLEEDGSLILLDHQQRVRRITAGDASIKKNHEQAEPSGRGSLEAAKD